MPARGSGELEAPAAHDMAYVRARWIPQHEIDWAKEADAILRQHGSVVGRRHYPTRKGARWRAGRLIRLFLELRMYERGDLIEHARKGPDGSYTWAVEYSSQFKAPGGLSNGSR